MTELQSELTCADVHVHAHEKMSHRELFPHPLAWASMITESGLCFLPLTYLKITKTSKLPNLMTLSGSLMPPEALVLASKT